MNSEDYIEFQCLEVEQPIGKFYVGTIEAHDLVDISYADVHRIEERDVERIVGIERPLVKSRVKEIKEYVKTVDATFPTSIILAVTSKDADYDSRKGIMRLPRNKEVAQIIDGQHRIDGLRDVEVRFQLNITIFVDMDLEDKAMVFSTINLKQTKVSKSLAYDLYEFASTRSPQKTCHNIAKLLNTKRGSPFEGKIKILGIATGKPFETLTQATFVERLLPYISDNPMEDRDMLKRGKKKLRLIEHPLTDKLIFRNMFIKGKDAEIARILYNYFGAVTMKWPRAWITSEPGKILSRTTGFTALMKFLRDTYVSFGRPEKVISKSDFEEIFSKIKLKESDFTSDKYNPGAMGETALYKDLLKQWKE